MKRFLGDSCMFGGPYSDGAKFGFGFLQHKCLSPSTVAPGNDEFIRGPKKAPAISLPAPRRRARLRALMALDPSREISHRKNGPKRGGEESKRLFICVRKSHAIPIGTDQSLALLFACRGQAFCLSCLGSLGAAMLYYNLHTTILLILLYCAQNHWQMN